MNARRTALGGAGAMSRKRPRFTVAADARDVERYARTSRMPVPSALAADPGVAGPLGSLALSRVRPRVATLALRAIRWHRDLHRLGVKMPLCVVHDLGLLLACPNEQLELGVRVPLGQLGQGPTPELLHDYQRLIGEVAESEAARRSRMLRMSDDLVIVLLARLLGSVAQRVPRAAPYEPDVPFDASLLERLEPQLSALFRAADRRWDLVALAELVGARLYVLTLVDALDLDTLQLFGLLGGDTASGGLAQVDLFTVLGDPQANDIVEFSLEILPSVLEAKARPGASTFAAHGYAGLSRKGSIDSLVLSELAWDELELARRMADDEVLYYAHEQARDDARRVHLLLVDASASMRGQRSTFARGMALAAAKKLTLSGEEVVVRFFDSRLYEPHAARSGRLPAAHLLGFRGEHGRNPARVFAELAADLELRARRDARQPIIHLFTHAALYIPRDTVAAIARRARIAAVFMLPSGGELQLDYLDLLDAHWVVDHNALASRRRRADEARRILDDVRPPVG
jgi:hypothetical protein